MVTKQDESTSTPEPQTQEEGDLLIDDSTPESVLTQEAEFDAKTVELQGEGAAEETEEGAPEGAEKPAETPAEPVVAEQPVVTPEPTPELQPEVKPERTFSQDEWNRRQSSWDSQQAEVTRQLEEIRQQNAERSVDAEVAARVRVLENQYTPSLGAEEAARMAKVQEPTIRDGLLAQQHLQTAQAQVAQSQQLTATSLINNFVSQEKTKHGLSDAQAATLQRMAASIPFDFSTQEGQMAYFQFGNELGGLAEQLGATNAASSQAQKEREAKVPPATPETRLETGDSEITPDSDDSRADRIMGVSDHNSLSQEDRDWWKRRVGADILS